jgi:two-component system LytT family sensor kinase
MRYSWKVFKWMVLAGFIPTIYFIIIRRVSGYQGDHDFTLWQYFAIWLVISIVITTVLSFFVFQEIIWLEKKIPWKKSPVKRILVEVPLVLLTTSVGMFFISNLTYNLHVKSFGCFYFHSYEDFIVKELTLGAVLTVIITSLVEGVFFFQEWKKTMVLSEKLQKENMKSQLEVLKTQVNPHFLFNSLNVLSSLVYNDPERADNFIGKFANVYRYILSIQGKIVVTLNEELEFLSDYIYLQKIRFNEGLIIDQNIPAEKLEFFIPPLCLQQLVENAIKHNIVGKEKPLTIRIFNEENFIYVINNLQKRDEPSNSTGVGLKNLTERYYHFANVKPEFQETDDQFVAKIPLLEKELH